MEHARLQLIQSALYEQLCHATEDWGRRGCPATRSKALRKLEKIERDAWCAVQATMPPQYEGPITRGVDPDPR